MLSVRRAGDLCCIDPPFEYKRNHNPIYNNIVPRGTRQRQAFIDKWTLNDQTNECYYELLTNKNGVQMQQSIACISSFDRVLTKRSLFAYCLSDCSHRRESSFQI